MFLPKFIIYTGPMYSTKTTRLLIRLDRAKYQGFRTVAFKPSSDNRYAPDEIVTHSGLKFPAVNVQTGEDILQLGLHQEVIGVDEAFMIPGSAKALIELYKRGKTVVVSSIQMSHAGHPFEEMEKMFPWATHIKVCPSVCSISGEDAFYTVKTGGGDSLIEVGGKEMYEPRSFHNTPFLKV
jgi:thymidine kinase